MGKLADYRLGEVIGRGGMAVVHAAVRLADQAEVAVKLFTVEEGRHREELACKFLQEAKLLAQLDHPNLVKVFDWGFDEGRPWLAMERVRGAVDGEASLVARLAGTQPLSVDEVRGIYDQLHSVLAYCHENEIVHGDLKAENVLLAADGMVKLADFGIARVLNPESDGDADSAWSTATLSGVICTPYASAPECRRGEKPSKASDVYSLGVLLFRMLTSLWYDGTPRLLRQLRRVAPEWSLLLGTMLRETPAERPASAQELPMDPLIAWRRHRRRKLGWAAVPLVLVLVGALAWRPVSRWQEVRRLAERQLRQQAEDLEWGREYFGTNSFDYVAAATFTDGERLTLKRPVLYGRLHLPANKGTVMVDPPPGYYGMLIVAREVEGDLYWGFHVERPDPDMRVWVRKHTIRIGNEPRNR